MYNYITNLQQENERLHNRELELSYHLSLYSSEETMLKENKDLQQRIEKAVEYIRKTDIMYKGYINFMYELENILNGKE